ncbi:hypothetical protein XM38_038860 [Halomicronema hongdechloris C2206]|uniref:Glycosyltransferase RgtA/B/C/D-like domain-containing protein n=1 Tax=Halomicronema hongdechloris C2206 TaxID=1641165 RepID=A0A1Z3HRP7_9CYAN|nr:hypothetical protein XM38_038860 [Halomicronema hongdechloris C2206]
MHISGVPQGASRQRPIDRWAIGLLLAGLLWRLGVASGLPLGFDEAYYYLYSRHLHWGYFDHPAMVAWTTGLGWWLTGWLSPLTVRIGALLLYTVSLGLLYLTAFHLFDRRAARLTLVIATLTPLFLVGFGILTSPDNGLIFFWSLALYLAAQEFFPTKFPERDYRPTARLGGIGLCLGGACLSKYHGFVLALGLVGFCLSQRPYRRALRSPWLLVALGLFALVLIPLLYWNSQHDWISFRFQLAMRFEAGEEPTAYSWSQMLGYWLAIIAYLFPTLGVVFWWVGMRSLLGPWYQRLRGKPSALSVPLRHKQHFILWSSLPLILGFTWLGGNQAILPAWPAPGFWALTLLVGAYAAQWQTHSPTWVRRWLGGTGITVATLLLVALSHLSLGTLQRPGHFAVAGGMIPPQQDASTQMIDVLQLRQRLAEQPEIMEALAAADFIVTNDLFVAGYLDMALQPLLSRPVTCFSQDPRGFAFWFDQRQWLGTDAVFMTTAWAADNAAGIEGIRPYFARVDPLATIPLERGKIPVEHVMLYTADNLLQPYAYPYP